MPSGVTGDSSDDGADNRAYRGAYGRADGGVGATVQLWRTVSTSMRELRTSAGWSLREVEKATGWGRASLSQIENGKARPTRAQVEWYDAHFGGDGLLVSLYAEVRGAHGPGSRGAVEDGFVPGDAIVADSPLAALGAVVTPGSALRVGWSLHNTGAVAWRGRALHRVGPRIASGLLRCPGEVPVADCEPGGAVAVTFEVVVPQLAATLTACWELVDDRRRPCFDASALLYVTVTAR